MFRQFLSILSHSYTMLLVIVLVLGMGAPVTAAPRPGEDNFPAHTDFHAAAACCARGPGCYAHHARRSGVCFVGRWMSAQPEVCQRAACTYCLRRGEGGVQLNRMKPVCRAVPILKNCFGSKGPYPRPPKKFTPPISRQHPWSLRRSLP